MENSQPNTSSGLTLKLCEIMLAVKRVPKRGTNAFHGYRYATEADVVDLVRDELATRKVMLYSDLVSTTSATETGDSGKPSRFVTATMEFTLVDGETGESRTFKYAGAGQDRGEKGLYKAISGCLKYFLLKLFLIPTGDDPEDDSKDQPASAPTPGRVHPDPDDRPADVPQEATASTAPRAARPAPGGLRVTKVTQKTGHSAKTGKPWTNHTIHFSDGRKASTFDGDIAAAAETFQHNNTPIHAVTEESHGFLNLIELNVVYVDDIPFSWLVPFILPALAATSVFLC